jgi:hypothetical protein
VRVGGTDESVPFREKPVVPPAAGGEYVEVLAMYADIESPYGEVNSPLPSFTQSQIIRSLN